MANKFYLLLALGAISFSLTACDKIGQTSAGGSDAEVKATFDKLPLEERVKLVMGSPAPRDKKMEQIKAMYAKEGKPMPENLGSGPAQGAPAKGG